ncbi:ABC transporter permease [Mycobacterium sp. E136]|uniref:MlaE family ABC transporter permease n=1 Tax=Mycobacterium sp. E136 TaxID=1834125 RepID=UPI0007FB9D74|nr:ABC transporter permease [Mycobacterium sp. E136]OBG92458.1 ABC transporter permease [Mycobacterium sp. E136]
MSMDAVVLLFKPPFAFREFVEQTWFVTRVSLLPTILMTIPFLCLTVFILNLLVLEVGAADASGAGAALGAVLYIGPIVTVLVISGAGATAMCADLGSRTIREEIDAMRVLGLNPVHRLVVPRVLAATLVATMLTSVVIVVGLFFGFMFSVFLQGVNPGAFVASLTLLVGIPELIVALAKALLFGFLAGLIACYKGLSVGGGPAGVGNAVNETVVFVFIVLFLVSTIVTIVGAKATL